MVERLDALQKLVEDRIKLVVERQKLAASIRQARESFVGGVSPAADGAGEALRYGASDLVGALDQLRRLMELKAEANLLGGLLTEGAIVTDPMRIQALLVITDASKRRIDAQLEALPDVDLREGLKKFFAPLAGLIGDNGIVAVRERELKALELAQTAFNATQSEAFILKMAVDNLVSSQSDNTRAVSERAAGQIESGRFILIALSVAALIAAILIAWLYVGRNIARRLGLAQRRDAEDRRRRSRRRDSRRRPGRDRDHGAHLARLPQGHRRRLDRAANRSRARARSRDAARSGAGCDPQVRAGGVRNHRGASITRRRRWTPPRAAWPTRPSAIKARPPPPRPHPKKRRATCPTSRWRPSRWRSRSRRSACR